MCLAPQKIGEHAVGYGNIESAAIAVDPNGHWHVVYPDYVGSTSYIKYLDEISGPETIAQLTPLPYGAHDSGGVGGPSIAIDANGGLHVTYNYVQGGASPNPESIMYTYRANASSGWASPQKIGEHAVGYGNIESAAIAVDPNGHWHVVYPDYVGSTSYIKYLDETSGPETIAQLTPLPYGAHDSGGVGGPSIAIDANGGLHVTYNYVQGGASPNPESIMYTYRANASSGWASPQKIGEHAVGYGNIESAAIAVDPNGHWHVVYPDYVGSTSYINTWMRPPGPETIAQLTPLPYGAHDSGGVGGPSIAIDANGGLHVTYNYVQGGASPNPESIMYTHALVQISPPAPPEVKDDGDYTTDNTQLHATWISSDNESGIAEYQYAIGTSAGGTDVVGWTSTGTSTEVTRTAASVSARERSTTLLSRQGTARGCGVQWEQATA